MISKNDLKDSAISWYEMLNTLYNHLDKNDQYQLRLSLASGYVLSKKKNKDDTVYELIDLLSVINNIDYLKDEIYSSTSTSQLIRINHVISDIIYDYTESLLIALQNKN